MASRGAGTADAVGRRIAVDIPLVVVGCDFRSASSAFRSAWVSTPEDRQSLSAAVRRMDRTAGFAALETCNRIEWIVSTEEPQWIGDLLQAQMLSRWTERFPDESELPRVNVHVGKDAAAHVFRLVAGMESLASGEAEIAGQFQHALQVAMTEKTSSRILNGMGRFAGGMAKTAFRMGFRSTRTRGVHVLVARFLGEHLGKGCRVVVAGMGEIGRKTADFLEQNLDCTVVRMNRTVLEKHRASWRPLAELPDAVRECDALVVATGARTPVIDAAALPLSERERPLLVLDVGIPSQVRGVPDAAGLEYRDVDALAAVSVDPEVHALEARLDIEIARQVERFKRFCVERHMVLLLRRTQEKRLEMTHNTISEFVNQRLSHILGEQDREKVAAAMRDMVRDYSNDVFDSLHGALEEFWSDE